ncbi:MAG: type IVB secretion system protein IcmH/DotU, partial [Acetobacteraceae bacterium]|nr:type IVB secretion system protein IcmH/DotU [Acetobacteraceae bacterium]
MSDNPFSEPDDNERTVLRGPAQPRPQAPPPPAFAAGMGGPPPMPGAAPAPAAAPAPRLAGEAEAIPKVGPGPLAAAAWPLLDLLGRLSAAGVAAQPDPVELRERTMRAFRAFEQDASRLGLQPDEIRAAHYALCAAIDDVVLSTPWGAQSEWAARSLVSTFHQEVRSGDRFFDLLTGMQRDPGRYRNALEVAYLCLALGMQGRYRLAPRGAADLDRIREGLYQLLVQLRGGYERELSPRWRGVDAPHRGPRRQVPAWLAAVAAAAALVGIWSWLNGSVQAGADDLSARLAALPPAANPEILR